MADPMAELPNDASAAPGAPFAPGLARNAEGRAGRWPAVDVARGAALAAMAVYHVNWDLAFLHWRDGDPAASPGWTMFGHLVAGCFLFLSGFGLVLARPKGFGAAARRIAVIAAAAGAVTLATAYLFPDAVIVFGILHCIAVTNVLALPLLRAPLPAVIFLALAALAAPALAPFPAGTGAEWSWTGLSSAVPRTLDFRPVLPWFGVVLLGLAAARLSSPRRRSAATGAVASGLAWAGRHSLMIYLVHQPVVLAILVPLGAVLPHASVRSGFVVECRSACAAAGAEAPTCDAACRCASARLDGPMAALSPPRAERLGRAAADCLRTAVPPGASPTPGL